jgi:hypothetical protein
LRNPSPVDLKTYRAQADQKASTAPCGYVIKEEPPGSREKGRVISKRPPGAALQFQQITGPNMRLLNNLDHKHR